MKNNTDYLFNSGISNFKQNKYFDAIQNFKSAYKGYFLRNNLKKSGQSLNKIGEAYLLSHQFKNALIFLLKGYVFRKEHEDKEGILESLNSLGEVYYYIDNFDKSYKYYKICINKSEILKNDYFLATALKNRGWLKFKTKKPISSVLKDLNKALNIAEKLKSKRLLLSCYDNLGDLYYFQNDFINALQYFNKILYECNGSNYTHLEVRALKNIGNIHRKIGDLNSAESFLIKAMDLAQEKKISFMLRDCSLDKALLYEKKHEFRKAYLHFKNYHKYATEIEREKGAQKFLGIMEPEFLNEINSQTGLIEISKYFEKNKNLNNKLLSLFPDISPRQLEIAGLIKSGISSKEISILLNIEVDSINKQRARIRYKMKLTRNQNLMTSLQKL